MKDIPTIFGCMVFNDSVMQEKLPKQIYKALKQTSQEGGSLAPDVADVVANAMKEWATQKGATHFTHWFLPMTGITAEKHDSFISPAPNGRVIMEFSGKELIRGEPDASSFPNGGLRATFEARGYTVWDTGSYAFVKDATLYIPTAFCSYSGEALDKKTPLLRSVEAINRQALRILRFFGNQTVTRVLANVGPEQEYFLIDKAMFLKRPDLMFTGRTLFGARPPKGQEMDDHYFGSLKPRVAAFMSELEEELWKLGILAKTKHNEVAPGQHELAPIFTTVGLSTDHNQLTMEVMKSVANKHNLACLLHAKPFAGVNGSGKHNNWSLATDTGINLLEPGETPYENAQFLLFLSAVIKAVDKYQDLLRVSVATASNDHRLGANEAPPAIVSIFLGDELTAILESIEQDDAYHEKSRAHVELGLTVLPRFPKDSTDRNRTSPFAFTGNKFEFRMLDGASSIAGPNIIINTIVAQTLEEFADVLEKGGDFKREIEQLIRQTYREHKRIVFNGNNYAHEWVVEAEKRGLSNHRTCVDALACFTDSENVRVLTRQGVLTESELHSRYEIMLEHYCKTVHIEALTMIDLVKKEILPAALCYEAELCSLLGAKRGCGVFDTAAETRLLTKLSDLCGCLVKKLELLEEALLRTKTQEEMLTHAKRYRDTVFAAMSELRAVVDELETLVAKKHWSLPTYAELLYSVH